jgi:hypothetical protein
MEFQLMAKFRADHYLIAEFEQVPDTKKTGEKVLAALKELPELKDLLMSLQDQRHSGL